MKQTSSHAAILDPYFARVGWGGATTPDLATLTGLLRAHMTAIPFENLDPLLGRSVRLDSDGVFDKLVRARRGGYCFEHATLFAEILARLGFRTNRHSARVVLFFTRAQSPRTHMFLTIALDEGAFVVDPGLGGPAATFPIPLVDAGAGAPPGEATHWMVRDGGDWVLRTRAENTVKDVWFSTLECDNLVDFEVANHFTATHPQSPFRNRLALSRFTADGRISVMNRDAAFRLGGATRSLQLADRAALQALLGEHFGIDFPEVEQLRLPFIPEWN